MPPARTRITCFTCDELLPMYGTYGAQRHYCSRECSNLHRLCNKYNLTPAGYRKMLTDQNHCCAACNDPPRQTPCRPLPHHRQGDAEGMGGCESSHAHARELSEVA